MTVKTTAKYVYGIVPAKAQAPSGTGIARRRLRTVIDESALTHPTVYVSGGRRGLEIELAPADLVALTAATVAALSSATPAPGS